MSSPVDGPVITNPEANQESKGNRPNPTKETIYNQLDKMVKDKSDIEESWKHYAGYGDEYQRRNDERIQSGENKIYHYGNGDLTIIASINVGPDGKAISGHDYDPEARSHKETEDSYGEWRDATPAGQRFVIFEGDPKPKIGSRDDAIEEGAESGLLQFLSRRDGVESVSGEPSRAEQARFLQERGVSEEEATLYYLIRSLTHGTLGKEASQVDVPEDITMQIYGQAALLKIKGFKELSEEEKTIIGEDPEVMRQLRSQGRELAESLNGVLAKMGLPTFEIGTEEDPDKVTFSSAQDIVDLAKSWDPSEQTGRLAEIQRIIAECRDKYLFSLIVQKISEGKKPFVVFGGSHVMSLGPVLEDYFKKRLNSV